MSFSVVPSRPSQLFSKLAARRILRMDRIYDWWTLFWRVGLFFLLAGSLKKNIIKKWRPETASTNADFVEYVLESL